MCLPATKHFEMSKMCAACCLPSLSAVSVVVRQKSVFDCERSSQREETARWWNTSCQC